MDQNCKLWCVPFERKFRVVKDFSNTVFVLLKDYLEDQTILDRTIFGGARARTPPPPIKVGYFMDAESIREI